jgi:hypothetical protein
MSQRNSGYVRQRDEAYDTPAPPVRALVPFLRQRGASHLWDPAAGAGNLVCTLRAEGFQVTGTTDDFLAKRSAPTGVDALVTNPPYGTGGKLACKFIEHALELVPIVAMLLRIDFDSGRTRVHLFRDNPVFAQKIVLLHRIVWFEHEGAPGPSENHCWAIWDHRHCGSPTIAYAGNGEPKSPRAAPASTMFDEIMRGFLDAQQKILSADSGRIAPDASGKSRKLGEENE